jgi:N-acetylmuramoyl-L-alanine amidase
MKKIDRYLKALIITLPLLNSNLAIAGSIESWKFDPKNNQLEFILEEKTTPSYFFLQDPPRLVIDLPNTNLGSVETQKDYPGVVRRIRLAQFDKGITRLVMEFSPDAVLNSDTIQLRQLATGQPENHWILRPSIVAGNNTPAPTNSSELPSNNSGNESSQATVTVPPLNPNSDIPSTNQKPFPPAQIPVIEFGQPIPK